MIEFLIHLIWIVPLTWLPFAIYLTHKNQMKRLDELEKRTDEI